MMTKNSTDQYYQDSLFKAHGSMDVEYVDGIHYSTVRGPLNAEFMVSYAKLWGIEYSKMMADKTRGDTLFVLTSWEGSMLCPQETLDAFGHVMKQTAAAGLKSKHVWFVPEDIEARFFMVPKWSSHFDPVMQPLEIFDDFAVAAIRIKELYQQYQQK